MSDEDNVHTFDAGDEQWTSATLGNVVAVNIFDATHTPAPPETPPVALGWWWWHCCELDLEQLVTEEQLANALALHAEWIEDDGYSIYQFAATYEEAMERIQPGPILPPGENLNGTMGNFTIQMNASGIFTIET